MARQYGEGFQRPVDPFTGLPYPGAPAMAMLNTTRPGGSGYVVLRDDTPATPPPTENGANCPTGCSY